MRLALSILLSVAVPSCLFGQASAINGQIIGVITDPAGAAVANAKVKATNAATGFTASVESSASGIYRFNVLPLGAYEVAVDAAGFAPARQTNVVLSAGATATIDFALQLRGVATEVVITASNSVIDPSRTEQGSSLSYNAIANLPLVSRNPFNFILQQPNVSGRANTEFGVPRKLNANGFNGRINYQLDGANNVQSDRAGIRLMPVSNTWVQEVQQVSNGFAPEFGNTVGTVFNTITRSGTNDLHGEGAFIWRRTPYSARPALLSAASPTPEVNVNAYNGSAGGALKKDKVFYFGAYERVKRDLPNTVSVTPANLALLGLPATFADAIPFRQDVTFFMAKVDWQLNSANRLAVRYNGHRNDSPYNGAGGLSTIDRTYNFVDRSHAGAVQLVSIVSSRAVNELRVQIPYRTQQQQAFEATGKGPAITIPGIAQFGNSTAVGFNYEEMTPEVNENFSYNLDRHALKFGGALRSIRDTQVQATNATYTFPSIAAYLAAKNGTSPRGYTNFVQTVGEPSITYNSLFTSLYAQDAWKPRANVTISYGLRYDVYRPPTAREGSPYAASRSFRTDRNNFAPRLAVAVGLGKWVLRSSAGIFFDPFQTDTYRRAILNNGTPQFFSLSAAPSAAFAPAFPSVFTGIPSGFTPTLQDITTVSPDFANLYSANANATISREITPDLGVTVSYLFTKGNRLPVFRNINLAPGPNTLADGRPIFAGTRPIAGFGNIISAESAGKSNYHGMNVTVTKRYAKTFELFGSYTWSHAIDDAPEQNNIDSGAFLLSDWSNRRRDRGNSLTDRRHVFNGNAVWDPRAASGNKAWNYFVNHNKFSFAVNAQTGENFNMGSNRVLNGDASTGAAFQRPLYVGRNTILAPATFEVNMRYTRTIPVRERWAGEFFIESTNLFNRTNVTALNSAAQVDTAGNVTVKAPLNWTGALDQRLLQLGLKFRF